MKLKKLVIIFEIEYVVIEPKLNTYENMLKLQL